MILCGMENEGWSVEGLEDDVVIGDIHGSVAYGSCGFFRILSESPLSHATFVAAASIRDAGMAMVIQRAADPKRSLLPTRPHLQLSVYLPYEPKRSKKLENKYFPNELGHQSRSLLA
jgi:hypothetical protein